MVHWVETHWVLHCQEFWVEQGFHPRLETNVATIDAAWSMSLLNDPKLERRLPNSVVVGVCVGDSLAANWRQPFRKSLIEKDSQRLKETIRQLFVRRWSWARLRIQSGSGNAINRFVIVLGISVLKLSMRSIKETVCRGASWRCPVILGSRFDLLPFADPNLDCGKQTDWQRAKLQQQKHHVWCPLRWKHGPSICLLLPW